MLIEFLLVACLAVCRAQHPLAVAEGDLRALERHDLEVVAMEGDGNCLFRSVSHQVYGDARHFALVRQKWSEWEEGRGKAAAKRKERVRAAARSRRGEAKEKKVKVQVEKSKWPKETKETKEKKKIRRAYGPLAC